MTRICANCEYWSTTKPETAKSAPCQQYNEDTYWETTCSRFNPREESTPPSASKARKEA